MKPLTISPRVSRDFPEEARHLIGVSGGRDSVALLHLLVNLGYEKLIVCHLNHQLRGRMSDADARFVQKAVERYNQEFVGQAPRLPTSRIAKRSARPATRTADLDFELGAVNVRALAAKKKISIETAAREARYKFFAQTARRRKCKTIFLAHHADDLVETFLINLFRGAGAAGLSGMREISTRWIDDVDLTIVRPFLSVWRKEIDVYVREQRIKFREDASNKNLDPLRNRIRHRIIPYLEKILGRNIRPGHLAGCCNRRRRRRLDRKTAPGFDRCPVLGRAAPGAASGASTACNFEMVASAKNFRHWFRRDRARALPCRSRRRHRQSESPAKIAMPVAAQGGFL